MAIWEYKLMKAELAGKICIKFGAKIMVEIGYLGIAGNSSQ